MNSHDVKKIRRHTFKAVDYLSQGDSDAEIPLMDIIDRVKSQTQHLKPVSNVITIVRNSLWELDNLGLIKKTGRYLYRMEKPHTPPPPKKVKLHNLYVTVNNVTLEPPSKLNKPHPEEPVHSARRADKKPIKIGPLDWEAYFQRVRPNPQGKPMTYHPPRKSVVTKTSSTHHPFSRRNPHNGPSLEQDSLYRMHFYGPGQPLSHVNPANRNTRHNDDKSSTRDSSASKDSHRKN